MRIMKIMKKILLFVSLTAALFAVSGCDFLRALVGRPTSEWIAEKEARIKADKELLEAVQEAMSEDDGQALTESGTPASPESISTSPVSPAPKSGTSGYGLPFKYYIVVGVFSVRDNAQALAAKANARGYESVLIEWGEGKTAVALNPTNDLASAYSSLDSAVREEFCPKDAWIMDGNRKKI